VEKAFEGYLKRQDEAFKASENNRFEGLALFVIASSQTNPL
jgi:hypothetical protein